MNSKKFVIDLSLPSLRHIESSPLSKFVAERCGLDVYSILSHCDLFRLQGNNPQWFVVSDSKIKLNPLYIDHVIALLKFTYLYCGKGSFNSRLNSTMAKDVNDFEEYIQAIEKNKEVAATYGVIKSQKKDIKKKDKALKVFLKEVEIRKEKKLKESRQNSKNASGERSCKEMRNFILQLITEDTEIGAGKLMGYIKEGVNGVGFIRTGDELVHEGCCSISLKKSAFYSRVKKIKEKEKINSR